MPLPPPTGPTQANTNNISLPTPCHHYVVCSTNSSNLHVAAVVAGDVAGVAVVDAGVVVAGVVVAGVVVAGDGDISFSQI